MSILEKSIEYEAVEYSATLGYWSNKQNGSGNKGKPDRVFVSLCGEHIYIEFKRPGQTLDPMQWLHARELAKRGCIVYECCHIRHAQRILDNHARPGAEPVDGRITYEMAAQALSARRIVLHDENGGGGAPAGPGNGQDINSAKRFPFTEVKWDSQDGFSSNTLAPNVYDMAQRDKEVGPYIGFDVFHSPRFKEGGGPEEKG